MSSVYPEDWSLHTGDGKKEKTLPPHPGSGLQQSPWCSLVHPLHHSSGQQAQPQAIPWTEAEPFYELTRRRWILILVNNLRLLLSSITNFIF